jgi:1,2-phenylacetyl-CoA epoxidase PaaB subunit
MPKKKLIQWKVYRLKGSPAQFLGVVHAPDEKAALKAAIKEFKIPQDRLLIRRA